MKRFWRYLISGETEELKYHRKWERKTQSFKCNNTKLLRYENDPRGVIALSRPDNKKKWVKRYMKEQIGYKWKTKKLRRTYQAWWQNILGHRKHKVAYVGDFLHQSKKSLIRSTMKEVFYYTGGGLYIILPKQEKKSK